MFVELNKCGAIHQMVSLESITKIVFLSGLYKCKSKMKWQCVRVVIYIP